MKKVIGRRGLLFYSFAGFPIFCAFMIAALYYLPSDLPRLSALERPDVLLLAVVNFAVLSWLFRGIYFEQPEITKEIITTNNRTTHLRHIESIDHWTTNRLPFYKWIRLSVSDHPLKVREADEVSHSITYNIYANRHELAKAIIEATYLNNPKVKIHPDLILKYGPPPYKIFYYRPTESGPAHLHIGSSKTIPRLVQDKPRG